LKCCATDITITFILDEFMRGRKSTILLTIGITAGISVAAVVLYLLHRQPQTPWGTRAAYDINTRPDDLENLLDKANYLYWLHNFPKATPLYERANELATQAHNTRDALYAKVGLLRSSDGMSFPQLSAFLEAQLQIPLVQNDAELRLWCLGVKGDADDEVNVSAAKQDWEQALSLAQQLKEKQWANRASGELGLVAFLEGDTSRAGRLIGKAIVTATAQGDWGTEVRYLEIVGNGFNAVNRTSESIFLFDRAIAIANRDHDVGTPFMAYEGKAEALAASGKMDDAESLVKQTLIEAQNENMLEHEGQDMLILGEFAVQLHQKAQAQSYFEAAFQSATHMGLLRVAMESSFGLSQLLEEQGDLKGSEQVLSQGLAISRNVGDTYYLPRAFDALAEVKAKTGEIDEAHALYKQAEATIDGMLLHSPGAYAESSLLSAMSATYLDDFQLSASQNDANAAFDTIERARGRTILDNMTSKTNNASHDPANSPTEDQISKIQSELLDSDDPQERAKLLEELSEEEYRLSYTDEALTPVQADVTRRPISLKSAQSDILPDEAVFEYVLADPVSYCIVLTRKDAVLVRLTADREQIERLISQYLSNVMASDSGSQAAELLYALLFEPIPNFLRMRRLVIVPDGALYSLPFDALVGPRGEYVLQSHVVSYAPSVTVLDLIRNRVRHGHQPQMAFLGVGDVPYDMEPRTNELRAKGAIIRTVSRGVYDISGAHLYPLPETRAELTGVSESLRLPKQSVLLLGDKATKTAFLSEPLADFKIIHFAVHGLSSPNFPERDALVLGRTPGSTEDGLLQVREIAQLSLNADLVTLSACNTATGKLEGEDGIIGLTQSFLFAGARTVASSLWPVDDSSTEALMKQFYIHLAQGEDEASALRQAKVDYLNENGEKPPVFWAPFVIVGDASRPISF
jgi:CHAT domain-containing protein